MLKTDRKRQTVCFFSTQLQFAAYSAEGNTKRFQEELEAAVPATQAKVSELQKQIEDPKLYEPGTDVDEALGLLESMRKQIDELATEVDRCKR